ncbi:MAG: hypothetical protein KKB70_08835 [Proteobacteria bacterium]|nr:hypothetical protein [Pseudomonadota bacterium]MBU1612052.1 hypothetical protein [Pseudomonadota bacterium]
MKIVEGHIDLLRMYREMSALSDSYSSQFFRQYVDMLDKALTNGFGDLVPRAAHVRPAVDKSGHMTTQFIMPDAESGRIVSTSS